MEPLEPLLMSLGLHPHEAAIYELLLNIGSARGKEIISKTGIKPGNVYYHLENLEAKGLVEKIDAPGKVAEFSPKHPESLDLLLARQKAALADVGGRLQDTMPQLAALFQTAVFKPRVKFYEGAEGIRQIHRLILAEQKEILAYVLLKKEWDDALGVKFWSDYYSQRVKNKIFVRAIALDTQEGRDYKKQDPSQLRLTRLIAPEQYPLEIEKNIAGNKVAYFSLKPGEQLAALIESPAIANSERSMFELAWGKIA